MTITGRQIREARALLGLSPNQLATKAGLVTAATIKQAEADAIKQPIADTYMRTIRVTLEALGIEFTFDPPSVRLRRGEP